MSIFKKIIVYLLTLEAKAVLRKFKPKIIAITGSVGKTSTKDAIYSVLAKHFFVRKSDKTFNTDVGIPLAILGQPNAWKNPLRWAENLFEGLILIFFTTKYPEWLVLEVGLDRPGDIKKIIAWLPVDIAVITRLPDVPVHVEFFESREEVIEEKAHLLSALKEGGVFIANADDEEVMKLRSRVKGGIVTYGYEGEANVKACMPSILYEKGEEGWPVGITATIDCKGAKIPVNVMGTIGAHAFLPVLAGFAVGSYLGLSPQVMAEAAAGHTPPSSRMRLIPGIKETLIIDDSYNASPVATLAALDSLSLVMTAKRKIAVLGDMMELGRYSVESHKKVGVRAAQVTDLLVTVGFRAQGIAEAALDAGFPDSQILQFEDSRKAGKELEALLQPGDCILIKGSQSMRMERAVEELMMNPEDAEKLLVRQEEEWKRKM